MFFLRHLFSVSFVTSLSFTLSWFSCYPQIPFSYSSSAASPVCFSDASALCTWSQVLGFTAVFFSVPSSGHCHLFQKYPMWLFPCAVPRQWGDPWLSLLLFFFFLKLLSIIHKVILEGRGVWTNEVMRFMQILLYMLLILKLEMANEADEYRFILYRARHRVLTMILEKEKRKFSVTCCMIESAGI